MTHIEEDNTQPVPRDGKAQPPTMTGDSGRQGPAGRRVLWILGISLVAALVAVGFYTLYFTASTPG